MASIHRFTTLQNITMGSNLIMGRKTWDSLPGKLPGREHFVLTRSNSIDDVNVISFEDAKQMEGGLLEEEKFTVYS